LIHFYKRLFTDIRQTFDDDVSLFSDKRTNYVHF